MRINNHKSYYKCESIDLQERMVTLLKDMDIHALHSFKQVARKQQKTYITYETWELLENIQE